MRKTINFFYLIFIFSNSLSQREKHKNLSNFDNYTYHFGFDISFTNSSFYIDREPNFSDSLLYIDPIMNQAFSFGPIFSIDFNKNVHLRTGIKTCFQDRIIYFGFLILDSIQEFKKEVRSVYSEIPLELKLRTDRINNYALYVKGGIKYGYDWASKISVKEKFDYDDIIKIKRSNYAYSVGGGIDFFLTYFKFGIDLKLDVGINNALVKNNTLFSNPIKKMRTQMWQVSFTFEA